MRILLATGNKDKLMEVGEILEACDIDVVSMKDAGLKSDPEEDGFTFEENALIKAKALAAFVPGFEGPTSKGCDSSCATCFMSCAGDNVIDPEVLPIDAIVADDSGLEIDALGGDPGVQSARFMGHDTSYDVKNRKILEMMKDIPEEKRTARFVCAVAALFPDGSTQILRGTMEGHIAREIRGVNGFGYDPIFFLPEKGVTSAEISREEKNELSHRGQAFRKLAENLKERNRNA